MFNNNLSKARSATTSGPFIGATAKPFWCLPWLLCTMAYMYFKYVFGCRFVACVLVTRVIPLKAGDTCFRGCVIHGWLRRFCLFESCHSQCCLMPQGDCFGPTGECRLLPRTKPSKLPSNFEQSLRQISIAFFSLSLFRTSK